MAASKRSSAFLHIVWKEYRTLRDFWLLCALIGITLQAGLVYFGEADGGWSIAMFLPAFFALGAGGITFAAEREAATDNLLRAWGAPFLTIFSGKLLAGTGLTFLLYLTLLATSFGMGSDFKGTDVSKAALLLVYLPLVGLIIFLAGVFGSLLCQRPVTAVVVGAIVLLAALYLPILILATYHFGSQVRDYPSVYLGVVLVLLMMDALLTLAWLRRPFAATIPMLPQLRFLKSDSKHRAYGATMQAPLKHLLWREMRDLRKHWWQPVMVPLAGLALMSILNQQPYNTLAFAVVLAGLVAGVRRFHEDPIGDQYRFLGERGISAFHVWTAKTLIGFAEVLIAVATTLTASNWLLGTHALTSQEIWNSAEPVVYATMFAFAAAGFFSLVTPSVILAFTIAGGFTFVLALWMKGMELLAVPLWWSVGILPAALLIASLVKCSQRLFAGQGMRYNLRVAGVLLLPAMTIAIGVPTYRVMEIPSKAPPSIIPFVVTPAARETAALYDVAADQLYSSGARYPLLDRSGAADSAIAGWQFATAKERSWVNDHPAAIQMAIDASRRSTCAFLDPSTTNMNEPFDRCHRMAALAELVLLAARPLEAEGKLDEAAEHYLAVLRMANHLSEDGLLIQSYFAVTLREQVAHWIPWWAAQPQQSSERILRLQTQLLATLKAAPPMSRAYEAEYLAQRHTLEDAPAPFQYIHLLNQPLVGWIVNHLLFWERDRAIRLLDIDFADHVEGIRRADRLLSNWQSGALEPLLSAERDQRFERWRATTLGHSLSQLPDLHKSLLFATFPERALPLLLGLYARRNERGKFPSNLSVLVGQYLDALPVDPFTGQPFAFEPEGFPNDLAEFSIAARQPVLWSPGMTGIRVLPVAIPGSNQVRYEVFGRQGEPFARLDPKAFPWRHFLPLATPTPTVAGN